MNSLHYIPSQHIYVGSIGMYTEDDVAYADDLEILWKSAQRRLSFYELLDIFPEARTAIKRRLTQEIKTCRSDLARAHALYNEYTHKIIPWVPLKDKWFFFILRDFYVDQLKEGREKRIKRSYFYLSALKPIDPITASDKITEQDIIRAKEVPIESLLEINRAGFASCPLHKDDHASLRIYKDTNRWWCFSHQEGGDVIDLVMLLHKCLFVEAVKKL